jgi:hypothetical protein
MLPIRIARLAVPACAFGLLAPAALAQPKKEYGTMHFETKVGSFKILGVAREPAEGHIEITFTGTVLVNGTPKITPSGNLKREYYREDRQQQAYHGTGKLVVDGKFWGIQWFGRDMKADWNGFGVVRLYGEFDKNLQTGKFWYGSAPDEKLDWGTTGQTVPNPRPKEQEPIRPVPRNRTG